MCDRIVIPEISERPPLQLYFIPETVCPLLLKIHLVYTLLNYSTLGQSCLGHFAKFLVRLPRRLFRDLTQQLPLPLHILLGLFVAQLIESVHVSQILVDVLELGVRYRLLHFQVVHQLRWVRIARPLSYVLFLQTTFKNKITLTIACSLMSYLVSLAFFSAILLTSTSCN